jgi:predicted amidohydrolase
MVEYKGYKIFLAICYDLRFPVWLRRTNALNYDVLLLVANWPERRNAHWKSLLQARAIENQSYVVAVNRIGVDANNVTHTGDSALINAKGEYLMAASQNKGPLKIYKSKLAQGSVKIMPNDEAAIITYTNGKIRKEEFYYGQSFLSQSSRFVLKNDKIKSITIIDNKGSKRVI